MHAHADSGTRAHLLLVEDDGVIALAQKQVLLKNGYSVTTADTGESAVATVASNPEIDLVLMDIDLGSGIDGTEAASRILECTDLPIVFVTSHSEQEMVDRVRGITRYGYVLKNSGEFVLLQAIEMAFELFRSRAEAVAGERLYRSVTNLTGEIIVQHDEEGHWTFLSDSACRFFGLPREELLGRSIMEFVHPDDHVQTAQVIDEMVENDRPVRTRMNRQKTPSGWRLVEWNSEVVRDAAGRPIGFQATGRDVTEREESLRTLGYHRNLTEQILDTAPVGLVVTDESGTVAYANNEAAQILGLTIKQLVGSPYSGEAWSVLSPDGRRCSLRLDTAPLLSSDGTSTGTVTAITDISKQSELEEHLQERTTILASISENVPGIVYQFEITPEQTQRFLFVSESIVDLLGISAAAVVNDARALTGRVHPDDRDSYQKRLANSYATLKTFNNRVRLISTSGESRWFESHTTPRRLPDGTVEWTGVSLDITDQVAQDEKLQQSERNLRSLFENSTYGIILADDDNRVVDCNQTAIALLGYTKEELVGMDAARIIPAEAIDVQPLAEAMEKARRLDEPMEFDGPFIRKDGTRLDAIVRMRFLPHLPQGATHIVSFNDVTARRRAERENLSLLREKELLLGELHHRVKNDLNLVQAFASLKMEQTSNVETRHALEEMIQRVSVIARVYEALQGSSGIEDVRLDTLLESTVESLRDTFVPAYVEIVLKTEAISVPKEAAVSAGIMVNELVTNSVKYGFPDKNPGEIAVRLESAGIDVVRIAVEDNGCGFQKETLQEADYGFGLTVVDALASQHGGRLEAGLSPSGGARAIVKIENKRTTGKNPGGAT